MNIDILHARKNAERFHKTTLLLASKVAGINMKEIIENRTNTLPIIIGDGVNLAIFYEGKKGRDDGDTDFITPYVVNGSFSLELHFKVLKYLESNNWISGHILSDLFDKLNQNTRDFLISEFNKVFANSEVHNKIRIAIQSGFNVPFEWNFQNLIKESSKAFENWRYSFQLKPTWFAGYREIYTALTKRINNIEEQTC